jgi:4-diphosphocytidyl-2-C-methyl-D-erythritol kinase
MISARAPAKINLALVAGPVRDDGLHEVATILQRIELHDTISLGPAAELEVTGFEDDSLVRRALEAVAAAAGIEPRWHARIDKRIPVAAGLGGGSSDAAAAIRLANDLLDEPLPRLTLRTIARGLGVDVAFFLEPGPQLGLGDGTELQPADLPQDYSVLLLRPRDAVKISTGDVYRRFEGERGFDERRARVIEIAAGGNRADLASLPENDLARSSLATELRDLGAFRADVSGAGPVIYALFRRRASAEAAAVAMEPLGETWLTAPAW